MELYFTCHADNDLYWMLSELGHYYPRYDDFWDAVEEAPPGIGVLALADGYPKPIEHVSQALLDLAAEKGLRLYIEYPAELGRLRIGPPQPAQWERVAVSSAFFAGHGLPPGRLLALHGCWYVPMDAKDPHLVLARAAGYRDLAFGLPDQAHPLLFNLGERVLVATSKLSQFITARYAPRGTGRLSGVAS